MIIFKGPRGVRAGWRFLLFAIVAVGLNLVLPYAFVPIAHAMGLSNARLNEISPITMLFSEIASVIAVVVATYVMARLERRSILSYGFAVSPTTGKRYAEGLLLGVGAPAVVALLMIAAGGMRISGFALHGMQWLWVPFGWAAAMILVGFDEEPLFRGYPMYSLTRGIGFWSAAIVTTLLFGAAHAPKQGENFIDISIVMLLGLFCCFVLWRTGSLWLAAGFHSAFDFMQLFIIGTPNGSQIPVDRLFSVSFPGSALINGGQLGTEASVFMYPIVVALFVYIAWRYPRVEFKLEGKAATFNGFGQRQSFIVPED